MPSGVRGLAFPARSIFINFLRLDSPPRVIRKEKTRRVGKLSRCSLGHIVGVRISGQVSDSDTSNDESHRLPRYVWSYTEELFRISSASECSKVEKTKKREEVPLEALGGIGRMHVDREIINILCVHVELVA